MTKKFGPVFEFHISRRARDRYQIEDPLFSLHGNVILADFSTVRALAWKMNLHRDLARFPEQTVPAGALNGMGLIDEILHYVVGLYRRQIDPEIMADALLVSKKSFSPRKINKILKAFSGEFPPSDVYRGTQSLEDYLKGKTGGVPHHEIVLEEMILLSLANRNPAFSPFQELFDDAPLKKESVYLPLMDNVEEFFAQKPLFGPDRQPLMELLSAPAKAAPRSIKGQLEFIRTKWHDLVLPFLARILLAIDLLEEEARLPFGGPGISPVPDFLLESLEEERYSLDRDWMPTLVLIAKSIYVWLYQLSRKYGRSITRLDQIPDEELDLLARWGFTGLWLIGLWERSPASMEIKQRTGNPEAAASAYSITDYSVAGELGGKEALMNLKHRAWRRGIRLAADMVPNHTSLDSRWMMEHPDWFIQLDHPPFPAYRFTGPDLSRNPGVGLFIEDGYWNRSEAAVVFKRVDKNTGQERFIYHGNDGTGLPWNDTAQLNFLRAEVREAVIKSILSVAADFPIIRFDAAMTLTKRHFLRLWFPPPGSGGAIPSRAGQGLPAEEFNRLFPHEFWREVVDRVAREASDTLLLAEAFWLLEGYFVRTLGMHRVYNSAFMNMLKAEHNADYRQVIKNILEFDPQILKRFVNFMNNPDEETAVAQFGKDDKYFGTAVMMVTLPGLPMFGHGQVEGFAERYGMEYRRAYWDEEPDQELIRRHEAVIFPLLKKRYLFSDAAHFTLYDLSCPDGTVDENVFAYSNRAGGERCLVLYNNKYRQATGWIRESAAVAEMGPEGKRLVRRTLGQELGLTGDDNSFCVFRDAISGLQHIRPSREIIDRGMWIELGAFKHHVLLDFGTITDLTGEWAELNRFLNGRGVPHLEIALKELFLTPVHQSFRDLISPQSLREWTAPLMVKTAKPSLEEIPARIEEKASIFLKACATKMTAAGDPAAIAARVRSDFETTLRFGVTLGEKKRPKGAFLTPEPGRILIPSEPGQDIPFWRVLCCYLAVRRLGELATGHPDPLRSVALYDEWLLAREVERTLTEISNSPETAAREAKLIGALVVSQGWLASLSNGPEKMKAALEDLFRIPELQAYIGLHRYQDILWFTKEGFEEIISWLHLLACLEAAVTSRTKEEYSSRIETVTTAAWGYLTAAERAGYRVDRLFDLVGGKKRLN